MSLGISGLYPPPCLQCSSLGGQSLCVASPHKLLSNHTVLSCALGVLLHCQCQLTCRKCVLLVSPLHLPPQDPELPKCLTQICSPSPGHIRWHHPRCSVKELLKFVVMSLRTCRVLCSPQTSFPCIPPECLNQIRFAEVNISGATIGTGEEEYKQHESNHQGRVHCV